AYSSLVAYWSPVPTSSLAGTVRATKREPATRPAATNLHPFIRPPRIPPDPDPASIPNSRKALLGSNHRLRGQQPQQVRQGAADVLGILRFEVEVHGVLGMADLRVGPEEQLGECRQGGAQVLRDRPLAFARVDDAERVGRGIEALLQGLELLLEELG